MTSPSPSTALLFAWLIGMSACTAKGRDPIVPESMQERSKERYGEQQMSMESMNQTPAEQASVNHHRDTSPRRTDSEEPADGRDND